MIATLLACLDFAAKLMIELTRKKKCLKETNALLYSCAVLVSFQIYISSAPNIVLKMKNVIIFTIQSNFLVQTVKQIGCCIQFYILCLWYLTTQMAYELQETHSFDKRLVSS